MGGSSESAPTPTLAVVFEGMTGISRRSPVTIASTPLVIGRAASGIRLADPHSSREHCAVRREPPHAPGQPERVVLEDRSSNGTWVNGARVAREMELRPGDVIRCGDSFLVLRDVQPAVADAPSELLFGAAPGVVALRHFSSAAAATRTPVLVLGEPGAGKGLVARSMHDARAQAGAFVAAGCDEMPSTLAESRLFGHVEGAFRNARRDHQGLVRAAAGGTLFLRAIDALPASASAKLLAFVREGEVTPVGATAAVKVDVHLVATTLAGVTAVASSGERTSELVAHLAENTLRVPPLRERREDVLELLALGIDPESRLDPELVEALLLLSWRGNVRELFDVARELSSRAAGRLRLDVALIQDRLARRDKRDRRRTLADSPAAIRDSDPEIDLPPGR